MLQRQQQEQQQQQANDAQRVARQNLLNLGEKAIFLRLKVSSVDLCIVC